MALVVEDGTAKSTATSYVTTTEVGNYLGPRGKIARWSALTGDGKETAVTLATDYIDLRFESLFVGQRKTTTQALAWPRIYTQFADNVIPIQLKYACFEYALRSIDGSLAPDPVFDEAGMAKTIIHEKLGPMEQDFQVVGGFTASMSLFRPYPLADLHLRTLIVRSGGVYR